MQLECQQVQRFPRYIAIVMPCMGSSLEQLQKNIPTSRRTWTLREVVNGIKYLHCEKNLAHMDVKPANVLLDPSLEAIKVQTKIGPECSLTNHSLAPVALRLWFYTRWTAWQKYTGMLEVTRITVAALTCKSCRFCVDLLLLQHLSCSMGAVLLAWLLTYGRSASFGCLLRPV
eukprot:TRINITY_DN11776_c0_g1_i3.p2 TRINITY_DN11776_c0_g1~~TRINITY_DN11776_c0_g1_i3.p2  ORF type:complete len:173 (-),score=11.25 TRINITY_DN11776_c0_g1_i3:145-663(-)